MQAKTSLAYQELSRPQLKTEEIRQLARKPQTKTFPWKGVLYIFVLALMMGGIVFTKVNQIEVAQNYNKTQRQLQELKHENEWLQRQMDQMLSEESLTAMAEGELQMQRMDSSRIEYIHFEEQPKARVLATVGPWDTFVAWVQGLFS